MTTTDRTALITPTGPGFRRPAPGPGESHTGRTRTATGRQEVLLTLVQLSDLHVCDTQSPARAEFLDRYGDPDHPLREHVGIIGSYRAQDLLTAQVCAAMVEAANQVTAGPVGGGTPELVLLTGDLVDNAQHNELDWYLTLLDGGTLTPDSGDPQRFEGVAVGDDPHFWHPEPGPADRPRTLHGFPDAPGLTAAVRRPLVSPGLRLPWLAVHGNHDQLVQGTVAATGPFGGAGTGDTKVIGVPDGWSVEEIGGFVRAVDAADPAAAERWGELVTTTVTPDPRRSTITRNEFLAAHDRPGAHPPRHGFAADAATTGQAWYRHDLGRVTLLVLDTVNETGGWQGCLDREQLRWLSGELELADAERRYVVLASHHRLEDLINPTCPDGTEPPALHGEVAAVLAGHPSLVLWLNGHSHQVRIADHGSWWEVTAPSLIDFPQQGRVVELLRGDGTLTVATTMLDHTGEAPWSGRVNTVGEMAGLSRELAANDWQYATDGHPHPLAGDPADRNALLTLPDPFPG
ncbi:TIGR03767 family metallophosphoesterase [Nakamurella alba]|uniref:TIGR03767 family metallophosphoesterase n=1 Tax=Nakamurella alba TaxID=2665158 RepID=UPI0018AAA411|nr:TIGR03767 family metallophosphoesterase [Nakamurella alba]